ncbi:gephyrin-like molybdotransferase Glp [Leucobacter triazinivorans]|uniref:molybdopterin molybdotransferase MoeA n=1 Tax=Leucobacter triazinivorans TaxID=1784719 RepID=UPI001F107633|nr:gephyrin-like molybdotransferase Glp [Leucobacter triazinivorans]
MTEVRRSVEEHRDEVRALLAPVVERLLGAVPERIGIDSPELLGRVTAEAVHARTPLPPFDNSQMDGFAVRAADLAAAGPEHRVALRLGWATAAGDPPGAHAAGTASPIMTGAAMPTGADAVVPVEHALPPRFPSLSRSGDAAPEGTVTFAAPASVGRFVRRAGEDVPQGAELVPAGTRLTPARIGLIAFSGAATVAVRPRPRVLLCSTGDELAPRELALTPGRIHDANSPMLAAALREAGAAVRTVRSGDSAAQLRSALESEADACDLIVTSGGISAGAFEVVRDALAPLGAAFTALAMQPGGPQGLGRLALAGRSVPVICFPGNPVSAFISAEVFLLPTLRGLAGMPEERPREQRDLAHSVESPADKHQVRRGRIEADGRVSLSAPGSHLLGDLAEAELLAHLPRGIAALPENAPVEIWRIDG